MVAGNLRSRSSRRVKVKTPGGRVTTHYKQRKPGAAKCARSGQVLPGVARGTPAQISKLSRSERRPSRPFGGNLSSNEMRKEIKRRVRASMATTSEE